VNLRVKDDGDSFERDVKSDGDGRSSGGRLAALRRRFRDPIRERLRENGPGIDPATAAFLLERFARQRSRWPTVPGENVMTRLLSTFDATTGDEPVFAWTHLNDLHAPLHPERVRKGGLLDTPQT